MKVTDVLRGEHRVIEQTLGCLGQMVNEVTAGKPLAVAEAREMIEFFRVFADQCHHGKEEYILFVAMESRGFSANEGPTAVMRYEHEKGRHLLGAISRTISEYELGKPEAVRELAEHARAYSDLLRTHIQKEDHCLFPMAESALSETDLTQVLQAFQSYEFEEMHAGTHSRFLEMVKRHAKRFGVSGPCEFPACSLS